MSGIDLQGVFFGSQKSGMFGCGGSTTVGITKDVAEETAKVDVPQDAHGEGEVPFLDAIIKPEIVEIVEEIGDTFQLLAGIKEMWKSEEGFWGTPIISDLDNDKFKEIIVYQYGGWWPPSSGFPYSVPADHVPLYVFEHNGSILPGWPVEGLFFHLNNVYYQHLDRNLPVIGDLDGDGKKEIVVRTRDDSSDNVHIEAFKVDGSPLQGFPITITNPSVMKISHRRIQVADIDGDGASEIVTAGGCCLYSSISAVLVWKGNGEAYPGFPIQVANAYDIDVFCGDLDGDKASEIIVDAAGSGGWPSMIHAYKADTSEVTGFPINKGGSWGIDFLVDINNDGCLDMIRPEHLLEKKELIIINCKGEKNVIPANPLAIFDKAPQAVADVNNDGQPELIYGDGLYSNNIYVYEVGGDVSPLTGWPIDNGISPQQIVVGNVDEYSDNEIIVGGQGYQSYPLKIYKSNGTLLYSNYFPGWAVLPALGDLDNDGKTELVTSILSPDLGSLVVWKFENSTFSSDWPMYGHDPQGSWNYETPIE